MTYAQQIAVLEDAQTKKRILRAFRKAATQIVGEDQAAMSAGKAEKRHRLGVRVLNNEADPTLMVAAACTQTDVGDVDPPYDTNITDGEIDTAIASVWDDIAGVTAAENA